MTSGKAIKVLIVDDSAMIRKLISDILSSDPDIEIVGTAANPLIAREKIKLLQPDVLTLDIEMPEMDGITFLRNLMRLRPMPVVMLSTLTSKGAENTLEALDIGAVDFVCKPQIDGSNSFDNCASEIISKVKNAATARVVSTPAQRSTSAPNSQQSSVKTAHTKKVMETDCLIALGASTGGTEAIKEVLVQLHEDTPAMVIAQHIPKEFSRSFAERMNRLSPMQVHEAEDGQDIEHGNVYIAPGSHHLEVRSKPLGGYRCHLSLEPPVNLHRPSVEVLFDSVTRRVNMKTIGVMLTGMGKDGSEAMLRLSEGGAQTIAQDEASSVIWGMPGEAVKIGAADFVVPLNAVAAKIMELATGSILSQGRMAASNSSGARKGGSV